MKFDRPPRFARSQRGFTLIMGLIMLVVLTIIAVASINMTSMGIQIVGNAQFRQEAFAAGQKAIDNVISSTGFLTTPPGTTPIDVTGDGNPDYQVTFNPAPACQYFKPVDTTQAGIPKECTGSTGALCFWTVWNISAVVTEATNVSGASVTVSQGVRTIAGLNSALAHCGV